MNDWVRDGRDRVVLFGCLVDALTMDETVGTIERIVEERAAVQHVAMNAAKVVLVSDDPAFLEIVRGCDLVSADGQSVVWASRVLGRPLPERVAGIDLMDRLLRLAAQRGWSVYFLGATKEVVERAASVAAASSPGLRICGTHDGYFSESESASVVEGIRSSTPDLLFVGMPSPKKEYWIAENMPHLGVPFAMGVGGSFDVMAGVTRRAPVWMQRTGIEWLYRFLQEPRRMWRRYIVGNARFLALVVSSARSRRGRPGA